MGTPRSFMMPTVSQMAGGTGAGEAMRGVSETIQGMDKASRTQEYRDQARAKFEQQESDWAKLEETYKNEKESKEMVIAALQGPNADLMEQSPLKEIGIVGLEGLKYREIVELVAKAQATQKREGYRKKVEPILQKGGTVAEMAGQMPTGAFEDEALKSQMNLMWGSEKLKKQEEGKNLRARMARARAGDKVYYGFKEIQDDIIGARRLRDAAIRRKDDLSWNPKSVEYLQAVDQLNDILEGIKFLESMKKQTPEYKKTPKPTGKEPPTIGDVYSKWKASRSKPKED